MKFLLNVIQKIYTLFVLEDISFELSQKIYSKFLLFFFDSKNNFQNEFK